MRCLDCGKEFIEKRGDISLANKEIGEFIVRDIAYSQCPSCHKNLFPPEAGRAIEKVANARRDEIISKYSISDFVTATEACAILRVSKQAFHKNNRIKKGFIYSFELDGKRFYLRKSVLQFRDTGDGRFALNVPQFVAHSEYAVAFIYQRQPTHAAKNFAFRSPQFGREASSSQQHIN